MVKKSLLISEILTRAVEEVIVRKHLEKILKGHGRLRVKFGIDPTASDLHLGHTVPLRKLKAFQELGHKAILIIGDFTALIGDPAGRNEARRPLSEKEVHANMKHYLGQAGKILNLARTEIHYNSKWYKKLGTKFLYELMSKITVQRALDRDDFQKRIKGGQEISLLEVLYPALQGYDSVAVRADIELGGTDQKFNLLMGRRIQRRFGQKEQDILTTWLIEGTDGVRKMSKSFGNYIGLAETPDEMFGKIMSIPDVLITKYFWALTDTPPSEIEEMKEAMRQHKLNPRDAKLRLGEGIVGMYHNKKAAHNAREHFLKIFSQKKLTDISVKRVKSGQEIIRLLIQLRLVGSTSECRRLIHAGAIEMDGEVISDPHLKIKKPGVIRVGKKKFLKITFEK